VRVRWGVEDGGFGVRERRRRGLRRNVKGMWRRACGKK